MTVFLCVTEPATGNYSEEIPPPTYKPPRVHDKKKGKGFVHEFDTHKKDKQPVHSDGKFLATNKNMKRLINTAYENSLMSLQAACTKFLSRKQYTACIYKRLINFV